MVQRPVFVDGRLVAWVGISAHMMDMGGMVVGSFAPEATECYQEGLRLPPVRLFRGGEEVTEVFDVLRNNVRMSQLVEMDLRGLVAGCHLANERVEAVVREVGAERFVGHLRAIRDLTETEMRRRIEALEDGTYRATSWTEFGQEFYEIPCALTVDGDRLVFDFEGASPQTDHFFNSKPYIIESELAVMLSWRLAVDLPFNEGFFAPIELRCPEGTVVNARPPAPIAAAHMHVGLNAADVAVQAVMLALGASPRAAARRHLAGPGFESAIGNNLWSWVGPDGATDAYIVLDGNWVGGSAGVERDGLDLGRNLLGTRLHGSFPDIEILESWYPLLFLERSARAAARAGRVDSGRGAATSSASVPTVSRRSTARCSRCGAGCRCPGAAGGAPGACNEFLVHRGDGSVEPVDINASGIVVGESDWFQMRLSSGGGFGDPLDREPGAVAADVGDERFSAGGRGSGLWRRARGRRRGPRRSHREAARRPACGAPRRGPAGGAPEDPGRGGRVGRLGARAAPPGRRPAGRGGLRRGERRSPRRRTGSLDRRLPGPRGAPLAGGPRRAEDATSTPR